MLKQLRGVLLLPIVIPCICLFIIFVAVCEVLKTGSEHQYLVPVFQEHQLIIGAPCIKQVAGEDKTLSCKE